MLDPDIGPVETASSFAEVGYLRRLFRAGFSLLEYSYWCEMVNVAVEANDGKYKGTENA